MGHELAVHRQFYRLQDDVIELAKISKLLLAVESGKAHQFTGMSIDDIDLDLLSDVVDDDTLAESNQTELDDGESKDEAENDEELHHVPSIDTEPSTSSCVKEAFPEPQLRQKRKRKCGILYNFPESEDEDWNQGHLQPAVEDVRESSDSDVEVGRSRVKKRKKTLNEKKMWTAEEKKLLKPLVDNSVRLGKPPIKECVLQLKKKSTTLEQLNWLKIKHQVWAMAQSEMKKNRQVIKDLDL